MKVTREYEETQSQETLREKLNNILYTCTILASTPLAFNPIYRLIIYNPCYVCFSLPLSFYVEFLLTLVDVQHAGGGCDRGEGSRLRLSHPEIRIVECEDQSETATVAAAEWGLNLPKSAERGKPDSLSLAPEDLYRSNHTSVVHRRGSKASVHSELLDLAFDGAEDDA